MFSILIVDDNLSDREGVRDLIDWKGLGVEVAGFAANGIEGYKKAMEIKPDFVLTDVAMPLMDGLKMAEKIKSELPFTKFIFMSCFDEFNFVKEAMKVDAFGYVLKPIDLNELTEAVRKIISIAQSEKDNKRFYEELKQRITESMPILREQFLRDLLYGSLKDENEALARMSYLGIDHSNRMYTVIFIEIDNYDMNFSDIDIDMKYLMIHGVKRYLDEKVLMGKGYILNQQYNSIAAILFAPTCNEESELEAVLDSLNEFKALVNNNIHIEVTIGIAEYSRRLTDVPKLYQRAEYAVKSKFYSKGNRIILSSETKEIQAPIEFNLQDIRNEIGFILEQGKVEDIEVFIEKYYGAEKIYTEAHVKSLAFTIVNIIQTILLEKNETFSSIFSSDTVIWDKLSRFETILDIKQWLKNILEAVRQYLNNGDGGRYRKIVEDIKRIIENNYSKLENIEQIVKPLFISASHANFIFKQQTGQTIFDYLIYTRMEAAKKMLEDPYKKIYEIAEMVGYKSKSYFGSVFKEYTGLTPKQYADKYAR